MNTLKSMIKMLTATALLGGLIGLDGICSFTQGAGLNTDVAMTPPEGGTIIRAQWRSSRLSNDPTPLGRKIRLNVQPITMVHGVTENLAVLGTVPLMQREINFDSAPTQTDAGVGDITLLAKYRFFQNDQPQQTTRWALIGGLQVPTYDDDFSSDSFDPIIGTVWTYQRLDWWIDWDLLYQFNTAGGLNGDDVLRADRAFSQPLWGGKSTGMGTWKLYAVAEFNARYLTDGSAQIFGSPGFQFISSNLILEAGAQFPIKIPSS